MTIRDLGYRRYEGELLPHRSRHKVLVRRTLSLALSSGLVKTALILATFPMVVTGVVMLGRMKMIEYLGDPGSLAFTCMYWCQIWFAFTVSLLVAAPAISEDVRTGAFQFYFARPVTGAQYLVGKIVPVTLLIMLVAGVPGLLLALLRVALSTSAADATSQLILVARTIAYAPIYGAVLSLPPVALSALGRRGGTIQGLWAAAFFLPWVFGESIAAVSDVDYVALISLPTNLRLVGQYIYGVEPSYALPWYLPAGVLALVLAASAAILLRRLARVEVFA